MCGVVFNTAGELLLLMGWRASAMRADRPCCATRDHRGGLHCDRKPRGAGEGHFKKLRLYAKPYINTDMVIRGFHGMHGPGRFLLV